MAAPAWSSLAPGLRAAGQRAQPWARPRQPQVCQADRHLRTVLQSSSLGHDHRARQSSGLRVQEMWDCSDSSEHRVAGQSGRATHADIDNRTVRHSVGH